MKTIANALSRSIAVLGFAILLTTYGVSFAEDPSGTSEENTSIVVGQPKSIEITPATIQLIGPRGRQQLNTTGHYSDDQVSDLTRATQWESSNPEVAIVENNVVLARSNGQTTLTAQVGSHQESVEVQVRDYEIPAPVSFFNETVAALSKAGCNGGACHGSPSGKNGFRLSLWGFEPELDFETLTHEIYGRRINVFEPEQSLVLLKPSMGIAHGGGRRMSKGEVTYEVLKQWIAEGLHPDPEDAPSVERIEVFPRKRILYKPFTTQQLSVQGYYSDGTVRDLTPLVRFRSSNENIGEVDDSGLVTGVGRGEIAVLVQFHAKVANARIMFLEDIEGFVWNSPTENNYVDSHIHSKLQQLQISPSDMSSSAEFVRRVYLDAIGRLPTATEVSTFLSNNVDEEAVKRTALIDDLLERPEYATFWTLRWGDLLRSNRQKLTFAGIFKFQKWIEHAIRTNMPFDQFAKQLLVSTGSSYDNPAANYFRASRDPSDATETTAQLFLGVRMQCAKCHNHPFERWTQDEYYGIASFFARVGRKAGDEPDEEVVFVNRSGEVSNPRTGQQMKPWLLLKGEAEVAPQQDRREVFAHWLTDPENPFFAKAAVNRIWGYIMGKGIVEPVDDFRDSNPPSNEELLTALAQDFIDSGFDQKHVIRTILNSATYQLSSKKNEWNAEDDTYFSHSNVRLLSAEQLLDAICQVTDVPEKFPGLPAGTVATALPDPKIDNYFLKIFGQPQREMACSCERSNESNLSQALQMINGPTVHNKLRDDKGRINRLIEAGVADGDIVKELYLWSLGRPPTKTELLAATEHVESSEQRRQGLEDVGWALLNSKEFLFQH